MSQRTLVLMVHPNDLFDLTAFPTTSDGADVPYVLVDAGQVVVMCSDALVAGMARLAVVEGSLSEAIPRWVPRPVSRTTTPSPLL